MDYSPPGSSALGISQSRILERVAIPSPGDFPDPGMEPSLLDLLHRPVGSLPLSHLGRPPGPTFIHKMISVVTIYPQVREPPSSEARGRKVFTSQLSLKMNQRQSWRIKMFVGKGPKPLEMMP